MGKKPNVIYILADDMGYGDLSCLNENSKLQTPHLDSIAQQGIAFTDAHSSSSVCTPSRYSILTGRYNWRSRLKTSVLGGYSKALIEDNRMTVANLFQEQGYDTMAIGKWHLGMNFAVADGFVEAPGFAPSQGVDYSAPIAKSPITNGFDSYYGISASLDMPPYVYIENDRFTQIPTHVTKNGGMQFWREGPTATDFQHEDVLPHLTNRVCDKIRETRENPFFLYFPLPSPHLPVLPSPDFQGKSGTNAYGDFVLMCDAMVGQVLDTLKETDQWENTIVIYTSDNGCSPEVDFPALAALGHHPSYHFRGHKADIYEGGHRIPYLIRWPAGIKAGQVCTETVCLTDFMATMAEILEVELPEQAAEDSVSNYSLWKNAGSGPVREDTIHQSIDGSLSLRKNRYKLSMCPGSGGWSNPKPGEEPPDTPEFQLYDLATDVGENKNIIEEHGAIAKEMKEILKNHIRNGRSTPGKAQNNNGVSVWDTIRWIEE